MTIFVVTICKRSQWGCGPNRFMNLCRGESISSILEIQLDLPGCLRHNAVYPADLEHPYSLWPTLGFRLWHEASIAKQATKLFFFFFACMSTRHEITSVWHLYVCIAWQATVLYHSTLFTLFTLLRSISTPQYPNYITVKCISDCPVSVKRCFIQLTYCTYVKRYIIIKQNHVQNRTELQKKLHLLSL